MQTYRSLSRSLIALTPSNSLLNAGIRCNSTCIFSINSKYCKSLNISEVISLSSPNHRFSSTRRNLGKRQIANPLTAITPYKNHRNIQIRCFSTEESNEDYTLRQSFGLFRIFSEFLLFALNPFRWKQASLLMSKGVVMNRFLGAIIYTYLQNPLLVKYKFDSVEFMQGAKVLTTNT